MPDMSVTIRPTGEAYRVARELIAALGEQCPAGTCAGLEPHVTIQYLRGVEDVDRAARALEQIYREARPFEVRFGRLGAFEQLGVLYAEVEATPELLNLYLRTKAAMSALGERTYDYDADSWRPHLTLSCRHWSREAVEVIRAAFPRLDCAFVAERVQVSRLDEGDRWITIRDLPLGMALPLAS